jgi:hypothetical protein
MARDRPSSREQLAILVMGYQDNLFEGEFIEADDTDGWCTPEWLLELVRQFFGRIDLDPCSNALSTVGAAVTYTVRDDGLSKPWSGRVWVNPPYSDPTPWMRRCSEVGDAGEVLALPKGDWSTAWWRAYVLPASARCQIHARVDFVQRRRRTTANFPSALVYYGRRQKDFADLFSPIGEVLMRAPENRSAAELGG